MVMIAHNVAQTHRKVTTQQLVQNIVIPAYTDLMRMRVVTAQIAMHHVMVAVDLETEHVVNVGQDITGIKALAFQAVHQILIYLVTLVFIATQLVRNVQDLKQTNALFAILQLEFTYSLFRQIRVSEIVLQLTFQIMKSGCAVYALSDVLTVLQLLPAHHARTATLWALQETCVL